MITKSISTSDGKTRECTLVVRNVTGLAEEKGFRLYWDTGEDTIIPALGLVTSYPFRTMRAAIAYGEKRGWGKAKRISC